MGWGAVSWGGAKGILWVLGSDKACSGGGTLRGQGEPMEGGGNPAGSGVLRGGLMGRGLGCLEFL